MTSMQDKVVFITGGARGMGRAHAIRFAQAGADVVLFDICAPIGTIPYDMSTEQELQETAKAVEELGRKAVVRVGDMRDSAALDEAVQAGITELGKIDTLISNAGIWSLGLFWEIDDQTWDDMLDVVLTGSWRAAKAVAPHLIERGEGSILFISSANGLEAGPLYAHYTAAKHGLLGLMRTAAVELGPYGIRVNAICPGFIDTPINDYQGSYDLMAGAEPGGGTPEDRITASKHWSVLKGRSVIQPEAVSNAALFLSSDEANELTGLVMPVDAGHMVLPAFNPAPAE